ncbi:hypothetical protein ACPOL_5514 [Acidisarcina polymorpha]|uniref:Uncharacterized protein n=1 Tax=Acidisarcina polymorpha TaxID=2211140 RepID=A0A2Z5G6A3_9BACT|nr:hypothetical protein [Acidisarcina polymorpha]AXC14762.1 hypothetical protein ACPOL_5514 [Acidisarcina polymorpha]
MLKRFARSTAIVGALLVAGAAAQAQKYSFNYFRDPSPNAPVISGTDLSPTGELVGWYTTTTAAWGFSEVGGKYTTIALPQQGSASPYTVINSINGQGKLVGVGRLPEGYVDGFLLTSSGELTTIAVPFPNTLTTPLSINSSGTIVGNYTTESGALNGFVLEDGTYKAYQVPGSYSTTINDINDNGVIVGSYTTSRGGTSIGFMLKDGTLTKLTFPGAINTVPNSINADGHIVGHYDTSNAELPFYFDGTTYTQIAVPGQYACNFTHIKNSGYVVGTCSNSSTYATEAVVGTPTL